MDSSKAEKAFGRKGASLQQAMKETIAWLKEDIEGKKKTTLMEKKNGKDIQRSLHRENR